MKPAPLTGRSDGVRLLVALALMGLTACGPAPSHSATLVTPTQSTPSAPASATPSPTIAATASASVAPAAPPTPATQHPTVSPTLLFAALEAKSTSNPQQWNTIAIAGLDGYARAKATFTPMPVPYVGCAGPVLPDSAHVAAGKVYYADGTGAIQSLAPGGTPAPVTTFPLTSTQQMLSFAVSPDGGQLLATIFTLPPKTTATSDPCSTGASPFGPGAFTLDAYSAQPGGAAHLLYHQDLGLFGSPTLQVLAFFGWDARGPPATYPTGWATQGGGPHHYNGLPVRVDAATGHATGPVSSDQACLVFDTASTGDFVCETSAGISVRRADGTEIWHYSPPASSNWGLAFLSPDETRVADAIGLGVVSRDGSLTQLPNAFSTYPLESSTAWLDGSTLIGGGFAQNVEYVSLSAPGTIVDLGFKGVCVGTVRT